MTDPSPLMFFHIGKTSGTSVKALLKSSAVEWSGGRHLSAESCLKRFGKKRFDESEKFTIVRNPFERFRSSLAQCNFAWNMHPNMVVMRMQRGGLCRDLFRPMADSLLVDGELPEGLKVFRFEEDVPAGVQEWLNERGALGEMPHRRKRGVDEVKPLRDVQIEWVQKYYARDFELFGYDPEEYTVD